MKLIYFAVLLLAMQWTVVGVTGGNGHETTTTYITYTTSDKELQSTVDVKPQVACRPFVTTRNTFEKKIIPWSVRYLRKKTKKGLRRTQMNLRSNICEEGNVPSPTCCGTEPTTRKAETTTIMTTPKGSSTWKSRTSISPGSLPNHTPENTKKPPQPKTIQITPIKITTSSRAIPRCCIRTSTNKVRVTEIAEYVHQDTPLCRIKAVRFTLRNNKEICSNPEDTWAKHAIKMLDQRTRPSLTSTSGTETITSRSSPQPSIERHERPITCCAITSTNKVRVTEIAEYVHQDTPLCPIKAVRFVLRNDITICSDPEDPWTKHTIKVLDGTTVSKAGRNSPSQAPTDLSTV